LEFLVVSDPMDDSADLRAHLDRLRHRLHDELAAVGAARRRAGAPSSTACSSTSTARSTASSARR
jgi:hypothetical protein